jgi:hypothetical protein
MILAKLGGPALLSVIAVAAVLTPVRFSAREAVAPATAECATCCSKSGPLCVVCSRTCVTITDAYDNGSGPCPP